MSLMDWVEPTPADLAEIKAEEPLIVAGVAVVDAESAYFRGGDEVSARRLVRARAVEHAEELLVQRRRSVAHTATAVARTAQVVPLVRVSRRSVASVGGVA
ncbi:DUF6284 family protein [Actinoalloteichus sp. GBA129-24]|uniref:DUF6284 family protein n=1 Tax=Actinoalloteichus sp. GBA129-24 TaxID=1612551 RepID=UPI000950A1DC|nr:DUF6284 family protein [Actinoalloteichus sp. GBA129-24]APU18598.1 hypothetical protein UA75_02795 [Actinoalloteichus sp. GBA129-24]